MTTRIACASTAFLTATTWAAVDATSLSNSQAANTALTTSYVESGTSTPGAITVDAIAVKIASRAASPSGTMSVHLATGGVEVAGTAVTVNVSDLPTCSNSTASTVPDNAGEGGWFLLVFGAPVTLLAATLYTVGAKTSSSSQVNLSSTATTNWSRLLRTTTTGAPGAGDDLVITKEWTAAATGTARTVTMDETAATDYGGNTTSQVTPALAITQGGTLTFSTSIAALLRLSGYAIVYNGGTLNIGTTGTPVARGSSGILEFDCGADNDFGLVVRNGGTLSIQGLSRTSGKNVMKTKLTANAAAAATTMTVADDTGWLNGDQIFITTTTRTGSQTELRTLDADATATGLSVSAGLTNAHSGTSPTQAYVGLLTQNTKVRSVSSTLMSFVYIGDTATSDADFAEFRYLGGSANATGKRGVFVTTTTGSAAFNYCSIHDGESNGIEVSGTTSNNFTIVNCSMYNNGVGGTRGHISIAATSGTNWTITDNLVALCSISGTAIDLGDTGGTFNNNVVAGSAGIAMGIAGGANVNFTGLEIFGCTTGFFTNNISLTGTITLKAWRNTNGGIAQNGTIAGTLTLLNCEFFGNGGNYGFGYVAKLVMDNCSGHGDTTFSTATNISTDSYLPDVTLLNCDFSNPSGIKVACTNDIFNAAVSTIKAFADNTYFGAATIWNGLTTLATAASFLRSQRQDRTDGKHRSYYPQGNILPNATTFNTAAPSEEMQPASASVKLESGPELTACNDGSTITISVYVRKDGTYNGNAPRLVVKRQDSIGVTADTVLDTLTVAANNWELLTGTTVAAVEDGAFQFVVDCDGTAGSVFVDDWGATSP